MPEKIMRVKWEDGANLSQSRKMPGDFSPLTRDAGTNELGQVTLSDIADDGVETRQTAERDELREALTVLVSLAIDVAVAKAAPHVKRWWKDNAVPTMRATRSRIGRVSRGGNRPADAELLAVGDPASAEVVTVVNTPEVRMSASEWHERFRLMLLAGAFQEEQWRLLSAARIEGTDGPLEVQTAMEKLSPRQVTEGIRLALEANRSLVDECTAVPPLSIALEDRDR